MNKVIIFDLDGTLVDNTDQILGAVKQSLLDMRGAPPPDIQLREVIGQSMDKMIMQLEIADDRADLFKDRYIEHINQTRPRLILGMDSLLFSLSKHCDLAIVTSKLIETAEEVLSALNLKSLFEVIVTSEDVKRTKPDPEPLILACELLGIEPSQDIIYIGDTVFDLIAATRAGLRPIGVTWGVGGDNLSYENCSIVSTVEQLAELL